MTIKDRLKALRKALNLTQQEFSNKVGITRGAIAKIEIGDNPLTEQMMRTICALFKVNYFWLRDGEGEMFEGIPESLLEQLTREYSLDALDQKIVQNYLQLPKEKRKVFKEFLNTLMDE